MQENIITFFAVNIIETHRLQEYKNIILIRRQMILTCNYLSIAKVEWIWRQLDYWFRHKNLQIKSSAENWSVIVHLQINHLLFKL